MSKLSPLEQRILNRVSSPYLDECAARAADLSERVAGRRVLAIGGAGSIGSQTVKALLPLAPASIHVVDVNENGLAELVRELRSSEDGHIGRLKQFGTLPLDFGSPIFRQFLESEKPFDLILNFAAIKHVRSEKDVFSVLHMIDTNILKQAQLLDWLDALSWRGRYFSVSTDKAANPSSFMGATKRLMEHVVFHKPAVARGVIDRSSARFANVAFSNGSLLDSFETRLRKGQLLACPREIRRYFVTLAESGAICTLAALLVEDGHIAIPDLDPERQLVPLTSVVSHFLQSKGMEAVFMDDEAEARSFLAQRDRDARKYPVLLTPPDTAGEKPYEEFVAAGETARDIGLASLKAVRHLTPSFDLPTLIDELRALSRGERGQASLSKRGVKEVIAQIEPAFALTHIESDKSLDQRV
jgi:FlaA1/EpsC-like NDP-sugar epimerase